MWRCRLVWLVNWAAYVWRQWEEESHFVPSFEMSIGSTRRDTGSRWTMTIMNRYHLVTRWWDVHWSWACGGGGAWRYGKNWCSGFLYCTGRYPICRKFECWHPYPELTTAHSPCFRATAVKILGGWLVGGGGQQQQQQQNIFYNS